jgi:hypothetical protein
VLQSASLQRTTQELIPELSGAFETRCAEALAHAALGVVGEVEGVVAPEGAVIVPEMVVWIIREDADGW